MISKRTFSTALGLAVANVIFASAAVAAFPDHVVRIVVPYSAGGPVDLSARILAQHMSVHLGQQVIVDNRPGASTFLGAGAVAKSDRDGYTMLIAGAATMVTAPLLYRKMPFKVEDLAPVSMVGKFPFVLMVRPSLGTNTLKEFAAAAKARDLNFGHTGSGSANQLVGELVNSVLGISMQGIPYKGSAQALTDLLGDRLDASVDALQLAAPNHVAGKVRILATTGAERSPLVPDVPTFAEAGYPNLTLYFWTGLFVAAGTPAPVIDRLNDAVRKALADQDLRTRLVAAGQQPSPTSPAGLAAQIAKDTAMWQPIVKRLGVQLEE